MYYLGLLLCNFKEEEKKLIKDLEFIIKFLRWRIINNERDLDGSGW